MTELASSGFIECSVAEFLFREMGDSFLRNGHPRNLTLVWGAALGDGQGNGIDHLGQTGLVKRVISSHLNLVPKLQKLVDSGSVEAHVLPLGVMVQLYRESGAGRPGLITKIGLGTYVDPRLGGAKANSRTTEEICEVIRLQGEEYLHYFNLPMDVAVIHGSSADTEGNISAEREAVVPEALYIAQAVKRNGGIVIAEVEDIREAGTIHARSVTVPGFMVDYVVVEPPSERRMALSAPQYNPAMAQMYRIPVENRMPLPMNERGIIARRAALELRRGQLVNLGLGVPEGIASVLAEAGVLHHITLTIESGHVDCVPMTGHLFGAGYNSSYQVDLVKQMDWYDGGGLDIAFLGAAQTDGEGNANISRFKGRTVGPGGFINIAHTAKKVCFCGAFSAGGLKVHVKGGRLVIEEDGVSRKYVSELEQISFSAKIARQNGQEVLYITERAVFSLTDKGLQLTEIAPGVDLKTQVLNLLDFAVQVSPELHQMDEAVFSEETMVLPLLK